MLLIAEGRVGEAEAVFDEAGILEGPYGVQLVDLFRALRRDADAIRLAQRLLRVARLGGSVGSPEVKELLVSLVKLNGERPDRRLMDLVRTLPPREAGFPEIPRLVALARMSERLGRPAEALAAAREAREKGLVDVAVQLVEWRALSALGATDEADRLAARLERLSPAVFRRPSDLRIDPPAASSTGRR